MLRIYISVLLLVNFPIVASIGGYLSHSQEMDAQAYTKIIKRGELQEKLGAAREIANLELADRRLERALYRELRRGRSLEDDLLFLKAYLAVIDDPKKESKGYKEFTENVYDREWPKGYSPPSERLRQMTKLIKELPLSDELIKFIENEKSSKKLHTNVRTHLLKKMVIIHPQMLDIIMDRLPNDADRNLSLLEKVPAERLEMYIEKIRSVVNIAPASALLILQNAGAITDLEINIALEHAKPLEWQQHFYGVKGANTVSVEILMANFHKNDRAKAKIFELFKQGNVDLVMQSYKAQSIKTSQANSEFQEFLISWLEGTDKDLNHLRSRLCLYFGETNNAIKEAQEAIWNLAINGASSLERTSCSYSLTKQELLIIDQLGPRYSNMNVDFINVVEKLENFHESYEKSDSFDQLFGVDSVVYLPDSSADSVEDSPEIALLFHAYLMLKSGYNTELAMEILEKFESANVSFVRNNPFEMYNMGQQLKPAVPYRIQGFDDEVKYLMELTPMDIQAMAKYNKDVADWEKFILGKLISDKEDESLNAIFIINEYDQKLSRQFLDPVLEKAKDTRYYYRHFYVEGLKHLAHFEAASSYLDEILISSDEVFANFVAEFWPLEVNQMQ